MASPARTRVRTLQPDQAAGERSREASAQEIAGVLEEQMTDLGLTEEEKDRRTAEFAAYVRDVVSSHARRS